MPMNEQHQRLCGSPEWAAAMRDLILPAVLADLELGPDVLELGPGFGAASRVLAGGDYALTALEINPESVERLSAEFDGAVRLVLGDGLTQVQECARSTERRVGHSVHGRGRALRTPRA